MSLAKLVQVPGSGVKCVQFECTHCGKNFITSLDDVGGIFKCRQCGERTTMPAVPCHYSATCSGTYEKCGGIIRKLSPERLAEAEREAWKDEKGPWAPTDSSHDDYGDIVGSITSYECPKCGKTFNARQGIAGRYDYGTPKCVVVRCNRCGRVPTFDELPVCDSAG